MKQFWLKFSFHNPTCTLEKLSELKETKKSKRAPRSESESSRSEHCSNNNKRKTSLEFPRDWVANCIDTNLITSAKSAVLIGLPTNGYYSTSSCRFHPLTRFITRPKHISVHFCAGSSLIVNQHLNGWPLVEFQRDANLYWFGTCTRYIQWALSPQKRLALNQSIVRHQIILFPLSVPLCSWFIWFFGKDQTKNEGVGQCWVRDDATEWRQTCKKIGRKTKTGADLGFNTHCRSPPSLTKLDRHQRIN